MRPTVLEIEVQRSPAEVFAFLEDLGNHWRIAGPLVVPVVTDADGLGATVRFGPRGLRRLTRTRVERAEPHSLIEGRARTGRSRAVVRWTLSPNGSGSTRVRFEQEAHPGGLLDRLLLALAQRWWLRPHYGRALGRLKSAVEAS